MERKFTKNDNGFKCVCCGEDVKPLGYSSRDHCPNCLTSVHVDVNPGDRLNDCKGVLIPVSITCKNQNYVITYKCEKCGELHNNKAAKDDNFETILSVMNGTYSFHDKKWELV